jgi:hypothetical protein
VPAPERTIDRYYDPTTGQFVSVDPMVNETNQPYAYAGDDPVNIGDPLGLCNTPGVIGFYPGDCATNGPEAIAAGQYIASHSGGGGFSFTNGFKAVADYGAGIANFAVSTATLEHEHVSDPYCGFSWASDIGYGYGALLVGSLSLGEADAAVGTSDAIDATRVGRWMNPTEYDAMVQSGTVQEGAGGVTYVANPATPDAYMQQAATGTTYAEFDVPSNSLSAASKEGWSAIRGPNSWWASIGQANSEMPSATNIEWIASKL